MKKIIPALILFLLGFFFFAFISSEKISADVDCEIFDGDHEAKVGQVFEMTIQPAKKGETYSIEKNDKYWTKVKATDENMRRTALDVELTIDEPGNYSLKAYETGDTSELNEEHQCKGSLVVTVTGTAPPKPPQDPCKMEFRDTTGATKEVEVDEDIKIQIDPTVPGNVYYVKANDAVIYKKAGGTHHEPFISIDTAGAYTLTAWHEKTDQDALCSGPALTVTVKGDGDGGDEKPIAKPGVGTGPQGPTPNEVASAFAAKFLSFAIGIAGGIAFLLMVFGAYRLIFAGGNPEAIQQGSQIITAAIVGLLVIIFSSFILNLLGIGIFGLKIGG